MPYGVGAMLIVTGVRGLGALAVLRTGERQVVRIQVGRRNEPRPVRPWGFRKWVGHWIYRVLLRDPHTNRVIAAPEIPEEYVESLMAHNAAVVHGRIGPSRRLVLTGAFGTVWNARMSGPSRIRRMWNRVERRLRYGCVAIMLLATAGLLTSDTPDDRDRRNNGLGAAATASIAAYLVIAEQVARRDPSRQIS